MRAPRGRPQAASARDHMDMRHDRHPRAARALPAAPPPLRRGPHERVRAAAAVARQTRAS